MSEKLISPTPTVPIDFVLEADFDPYKVLIEKWPEYLQEARKTSNDAVSYRGFKVGALAMGVNPYTETIYTDIGYNTKNRPDANKKCAEMRVLGKLAKGPSLVIPVIIVTGMLQHENVTGQETKTLHPCEACRPMLETSPLILPSTLILLGRRRSEEFECYTLKEFLDLHATKSEKQREEMADDAIFSDPHFNGWKDRRDRYEGLPGGFAKVRGIEGVLDRPTAARFIITGKMPR